MTECRVLASSHYLSGYRLCARDMVYRKTSSFWQADSQRRLDSAISFYETGYFCFLFFHRFRASCALYVLIAEATYCPSLPSSVITAFISTMDESGSSMVFVHTHHCIGRYSLLAHVQNHPGLPGTLDITISGMPCSRTPVCFHSLALTTNLYGWPVEAADHPAQSIDLTKLNHFTLSHYGVPVPCPTLKHHC